VKLTTISQLNNHFALWADLLVLLEMLENLALEREREREFICQVKQ